MKENNQNCKSEIMKYQYTFSLISYARIGSRIIEANDYDDAINQIQKVVDDSKQYYDYRLQSTTDEKMLGLDIFETFRRWGNDTKVDNS